jgi:UDP-3-O-[3-hydroxymyristoyl] N-acetylglucosamine deacetylase
MVLRPMPVDHGIQFLRSDLADSENEIVLGLDQVSAAHRGTRIANSHGCEIATVEHLLAALMAFGVDNIQIEVNGPEIPAMDGSAAVFADLLENVGLAEQETPRKYIRILREIEVSCGESKAKFIPHDRFEVEVSISYANAVIGDQSSRFDVNRKSFVQDIARARTFVLESEIKALVESGLSKGGSLDNCLVVHDDHIENPGSLRFPSEFARHKALDALGDLALAGSPILGRYMASKGGHRVNHLALSALISDSSAWVYETLPQARKSVEIRAAQ